VHKRLEEKKYLVKANAWVGSRGGGGTEGKLAMSNINLVVVVVVEVVVVVVVVAAAAAAAGLTRSKKYLVKAKVEVNHRTERCTLGRAHPLAGLAERYS